MAGGCIIATIPGDVDGNFKVDIFDLVKITGCYGKISGDPLARATRLSALSFNHLQHLTLSYCTK